MICEKCNFETENSFQEIRHSSEHLLENLKCIHKLNCKEQFHLCEPCKLRKLLKIMVDGSIMDVETLELAIRSINQLFGYTFNSTWTNTFKVIETTKPPMK